jgi:hypothetical protein
VRATECALQMYPAKRGRPMGAATLLKKLFSWRLPDHLATELAQLRAERDTYLAERDAYLTQRDIALGERNELQRQLAVAARTKLESDEEETRRVVQAVHDQINDRIPAQVLAMTAERDSYLAQRDQAYGELDQVIQERNQLKGELERLQRQFSSG